MHLLFQSRLGYWEATDPSQCLVHERMSIFNETSVLSTPTIMRIYFHPGSIPSTQTNRLSAHICPPKPVVLALGPASLALVVLCCHRWLAKRNGSGQTEREIHRTGTTNGYCGRFRKEHESRAKDAIQMTTQQSTNPTMTMGSSVRPLPVQQYRNRRCVLVPAMVLFMILLLSTNHNVNGDSLMGATQTTYAEGEQVNVKMNAVRSIHTQVPKGHYSVPGCVPDGGPTEYNVTFGE